MKTLRLNLFAAAAIVFALSAFTLGFAGPTVGLFIALLVVAPLLQSPQARCNDVTLSVPELLMDVMEAFKLELFAMGFFSTDYSSKTAVKDDKITAHIAGIPATAAYDNTTGFLGGIQDADSLITDVALTLNQLRHCPVRVKFITQLASKLPLYRECTRNTGYALAKYVLDYCMALVTTTNFKNEKVYASPNFTLDSLEDIRSQLNTQKAAAVGRFGIINTTYAAALQNDDRVKSSLFYAQLNGDRGYRVFQNVAGFERIIEYPDLPTTNNLVGFFGDKRAIVLGSRQIDFANAAVELGVPQVIEFVPIEDPETGLTMTAAGWQQPGTGDVIYSPALLFGAAAGTGAGPSSGTAGTGTDYAGVRLVSAATS